MSPSRPCPRQTQLGVCGGSMSRGVGYQGWFCSKCGASWSDRYLEDVLGWSEPHHAAKPEVPRVVWLRSTRVSYTAELPPSQLGLKGEILNRPDLADFKWERWG